MADRTARRRGNGEPRSERGRPSRPRAPGPAGWRSRQASRVMWIGFLVSAVVHLVVWAVGPEVRFPAPDSLWAESGLQVLPALEEPPPPVVEVPTAPEPIPRPSEPVASESGGEAQESSPPPFIPHDVRPRLTNASFIQEYLEAFYPPTLRSANMEARIRLWLFVTREGRVDKVRVQSSSGFPAFDSLAVSASSVMNFRPALSGDQNVGVWVEQWIRFRVEPPRRPPIAADTPEGT